MARKIKRKRRLGDDVEPHTVRRILFRIKNEWCERMGSSPEKRGCIVGVQMLDAVVRRDYEGVVTVMDRNGIENKVGFKCLDAARYYQKSKVAADLFDQGCLKAVRIFNNDLLLVGSVKF
jgi:hypothetical protein